MYLQQNLDHGLFSNKSWKVLAYFSTNINDNIYNFHVVPRTVKTKLRLYSNLNILLEERKDNKDN